MHSTGLNINSILSINVCYARRTTKLHNLPLSIVAQSQLLQRISVLFEDGEHSL